LLFLSTISDLQAQSNDPEAAFSFSLDFCKASCSSSYSGPGTIVSRQWFLYEPHPFTLPSTSDLPNPIFDLPYNNYFANGISPILNHWTITHKVVVRMPNGSLATKSAQQFVYPECQSRCDKLLYRYDVRGCLVTFGPSYFPSTFQSIYWEFGDGSSSGDLISTHT
jgi:hypothetical protein